MTSLWVSNGNSELTYQVRIRMKCRKLMSSDDSDIETGIRQSAVFPIAHSTASTASSAIR